MPHVILADCCNDATCVTACPVDCIHPTPQEPDFLLTEMLYIDPHACIDCGACAAACPIGAAVPDTALGAATQPFAELNASYFATPPVQAPLTQQRTGRERVGSRGLRIAIIGSGPAAMYCAAELTQRSEDEVMVNIFDRMPTPWGLARVGVAPDHTATRQITEVFEQVASRPGVHLFLGVEVGSDVSMRELADHHDAIIVASGAQSSRALGIPGEGLRGSHPAADVVNWYNGHPHAASVQVDLDHHRAIVIGNGNVSLDIARLLLADPRGLASTHIAQNALDQLFGSAVSEVVLVGRRGPAEAAYTTSQMMAMMKRDDFDVVADADDVGRFLAHVSYLDGLSSTAKRKVALAEALAGRTPRRSRRLVLRFGWSSTHVLGSDRVERLALARSVPAAASTPPLEREQLELDCGLVVSSVGRAGEPVPGVAFDRATGTIPHRAGRVIDPELDEPVTGQYVVGWIKRGPTGFLGTNRRCAQETVASLLNDWQAGSLRRGGTAGQRELESLVAGRVPDVIDTAGWRAIDAVERSRAIGTSAPRSPIVESSVLVSIGRRP